MLTLFFAAQFESELNQLKCFVAQLESRVESDCFGD